MRRFAALLALAAIVIGLPLVLISLNADPTSWPSWETVKTAVTSPDDGTLLLGLLKTAGWLVWAALTFSIVLEGIARLRGATVPSIRGLGGAQRLARALLGAVFLTGSVVLPTAAAHAAPTVSITATTPTTITGDSAPAPAAKAPPQKPMKPVPSRATITHTVARGETLWGLAEKHLGEGRRYQEIVDLNPDLLEGRGDFLRTGWTLRLPAPPSTYTVQPGDTLRGIAATFLGDADRYPEIRTADGAPLSDPDHIEAGWTLHLPSTTPAAAPAAPAPVEKTTKTRTEAPADPAPATPAPATPQAPLTESPAPTPAPAAAPAATIADADSDSGIPWMPLLPIGVGAALAAGVTTHLRGRRQELQRTRRPGQRLPAAPTDSADALERALHDGADPLTQVDALLRQLAADCATAGTTLPLVRAARATPTQLDLYLDAPATLPSPWVAATTTTVWTTPIPTDALPTPAVPAPYPTLVTLGRDTEDGQILLNLEAVGALDITTSTHQARAREILAALAVELASSTWADDIRVTIVGACADLEDALQTGRITYLPTIARYLDGLEQRATADRDALTEQDVTLVEARARDLVRDAWTPEVVLTAAPLTDAQQQRIATLLQERPRVAIAVITTDTPITDWAIVLDDTNPTSAVLQPAGLALTPQHLPAESYRDLLATADLVRTEEMVTVEDAPAEPTFSTTPTEIPASLFSAADSVLKHTITIAAGPPAATPRTTQLPDAPEDGTLGSDTEDTPLVDQEPIPTAPADDAPTDPAEEHLADATPATPAEEQPADGEPTGPVTINMLGPITLTGARGTCEPSRQARLTELAAFLALNPGASHTSIDDAIWPNRTKEDNTATRHPVATRLRAWLGTADDGAEFFPRHQSEDAGYRLHHVTTDIGEWDRLISGRPLSASTETLTHALSLVRGRPFTGPRIRYYGWAESTKHRLIAEIVDASYELARRHYMSSHWRDAEKALAVGLDIEPAQERLHRLRILTCHEARDIAARDEAVARMRAIMDELDLAFEPETEDLLAALDDHTRLDDARSAI